jgi:hypothetical protein
MREIEFTRFTHIDGVDGERGPVAGGYGYPAVKINGRRHHEPVVVVGVFANQVHASGCAIETAVSAEESLETGAEITGTTGSVGK